MKIVAAVALGLLVALIVMVGRRRFGSHVRDDIAALFDDPAPSVGWQQLQARWRELPEPVRRYLHYAVAEATPQVSRARLRHGGFMRTSPDGRWLAVDAEEYFVAGRPGFVWHATARMAPGLWFEARDRLVSGRGEMLVKVESIVTAVRSRGAEIDQGSRLRWLAEAIWFPYAFVGDGIRWEAVDAHSAKATLLDGGSPVSAVMTFEADGRLSAIRADRYRDVGSGKAVLTPWFGRCTDYRMFTGFRVPTSVEVGWILDGTDFTAFRFHVTALEYNVAQPWRS